MGAGAFSLRTARPARPTRRLTADAPRRRSSRPQHHRPFIRHVDAVNGHRRRAHPSSPRRAIVARRREDTPTRTATLTFFDTSRGDVCFTFSAHFTRAGVQALPSTAGYTTLYDNSTASSIHTACAYKVMGSTPDTAVSFPGTSVTSDACAAVALVLRGVDASVLGATPVFTNAGGSVPVPVHHGVRARLPDHRVRRRAQPRHHHTGRSAGTPATLRRRGYAIGDGHQSRPAVDDDDGRKIPPRGHPGQSARGMRGTIGGEATAARRPCSGSRHGGGPVVAALPPASSFVTGRRRPSWPPGRGPGGRHRGRQWPGRLTTAIPVATAATPRRRRVLCRWHPRRSSAVVTSRPTRGPGSGARGDGPRLPRIRHAHHHSARGAAAAASWGRHSRRAPVIPVGS
jgi:hypothetical protein